MDTANRVVQAVPIEMKAIADLKPYEKNARKHSESQINQIAASIREYGFTNPILVDREAGIIAGHGRLKAAKQLGLKTVPVVILNHLSATQKKAYLIADNKLAELATWDETLLAEELKALQEAEYDVELTGFSDEEIEALFSGLNENDRDEVLEAEVPGIEEKAVSQRGQVWLLGNHKVMCGDACEAVDFELLLGRELADMVFTDPPYNVDYQVLPTARGEKGHRRRSRERVILNDKAGEGFFQFLQTCCEQLIGCTKGAIYICMGASELHTLHQAFTVSGGRCSTFIMWVKNHFTMGYSDYRHQYEVILYGWPDGRDRAWYGGGGESDVWEIDKVPKNQLHPTMKPVALCERAILNSSQRKDIVLDCFGGSGSTLIACEKTHRCGRIMELDPKYVDVMIKRWQAYTGLNAVDEKTGKRFNDFLGEAKQDEGSHVEGK